jgi:hypothetical protein
MFCVQCNKKIGPNEEATTIAPNQVICENCSDDELDKKPWSGPEDSRKAVTDSRTASKMWQE